MVFHRVAGLQLPEPSLTIPGDCVSGKQESRARETWQARHPAIQGIGILSAEVNLWHTHSAFEKYTKLFFEERERYLPCAMSLPKYPWQAWLKLGAGNSVQGSYVSERDPAT